MCISYVQIICVHDCICIQRKKKLVNNEDKMNCKLHHTHLEPAHIDTYILASKCVGCLVLPCFTMFHHQTFLKLPHWQQFIISKGHFQKCGSCIHDFITFHETNSKSPWKWMLGWEFAYFSGAKRLSFMEDNNPFPVDQRPVFCLGFPTIRRHGLVRAIGAQWWGTCDAARPGSVNPKIRWRNPKELKELLNLHSKKICSMLLFWEVYPFYLK